MKIRHPWLIALLGALGAWAVRLWLRTLSYEYRAVALDTDPTRPDCPGRYVYAVWHENMLLPARHFARPDIWILISGHADGQIFAQAARRFGANVIAGSTTRGGVEAVRRMLGLARGAHLAITPDGPRGPRRKVQRGLVYLAARTGLPVVPVGIGFDRPWRLRSWDRFAVPRPWSRARCVVAPPIAVPADAGREDLERYRLQVEQALCQATETAEAWAETGEWPGIRGQGSGVRSQESGVRDWAPGDGQAEGRVA